MRPITRISAVLFLMAASSLGGLAVTPTASGAQSCPAPSKPMTFEKQKYIDTTRAGGEPTVEMHPDGTLLYGSHAGTTHFYTPAAADPTTAAFVENYTGQTYYYFSKDNGKTWTFQERTLPPNGTPFSGFSDPEYAIDSAGQVYVSEINLANVAVSKAPGPREPFELQNFFGQTVTDRQWMEADKKDVLYIVGNAFAGGTFPTDPVGNVGHYLYRSTDGGQTFSEGVEDGDGLGDLQIDRSNGTLYEAYYGGGTLSMTAYRKARQGNLNKRETNEIAKDVSMLSHWPSFDLDSDGNMYITWDESGEGNLAAGIWFSYSTDKGKTWAKPTRVDTNDHTDIWPWLAVGDPGKVAVAWFEADTKLPNHDAETEGDHGWRVHMAQTLNGLGCAGSDSPGFRAVVATPRPIHEGTICQGGTACQAFLIDRRLGDFFTIEIDNTGRVWGGYSDTAQGGATALPGFVRQKGGTPFIEVEQAGPDTPDVAPVGGGSGGGGADERPPSTTDGTDDAVAADSEERSGTLAFTGASIAVLILVGLGIIVAGAFFLGRSRQV